MYFPFRFSPCLFFQMPDSNPFLCTWPSCAGAGIKTLIQHFAGKPRNLCVCPFCKHRKIRACKGHGPGSFCRKSCCRTGSQLLILCAVCTKQESISLSVGNNLELHLFRLPADLFPPVLSRQRYREHALPDRSSRCRILLSDKFHSGNRCCNKRLNQCAFLRSL